MEIHANMAAKSVSVEQKNGVIRLLIIFFGAPDSLLPFELPLNGTASTVFTYDNESQNNQRKRYGAE